MENIVTITTIVVAVISVAVTIINFILSKCKIIRNKITLTEENKELTEENKDLLASLKSVKGANELVTKIIPQAIAFVEGSGIVGSELKEMLALSKILITCQSEGIEYDEITIKELITKLINFTKKVNADKVIEEKVAIFKEGLKDQVDVFRSSDTFIELVPKGIDKGYSLSLLAKHLNIHPDQIVAFGDESNDISMLRFVGLGVAVVNATEPAKAAADIITKSNNEDGVAHVLDAMILD